MLRLFFNSTARLVKIITSKVVTIVIHTPLMQMEAEVTEIRSEG